MTDWWAEQPTIGDERLVKSMNEWVLNNHHHHHHNHHHHHHHHSKSNCILHSHPHGTLSVPILLLIEFLAALINRPLNDDLISIFSSTSLLVKGSEWERKRVNEREGGIEKERVSNKDCTKTVRQKLTDKQTDRLLYKRKDKQAKLCKGLSLLRPDRKTKTSTAGVHQMRRLHRHSVYHWCL